MSDKPDTPTSAIYTCPHCGADRPRMPSPEVGPWHDLGCRDYAEPTGRHQ